MWVPAFKRAGLTYVKRQDGMHAMRHFYASVLLARGASIKELAEYLGHEDPGFTLRTYTHLMPSSHQRARKAVDGVFKPRETPSTQTALGDQLSGCTCRKWPWPRPIAGSRSCLRRW